MFGGVGGKACWASLGRVLVGLGESGCFVVDIFKVEMDIGCARLGRKRRRSWRKSRDENHHNDHEMRIHIHSKKTMFHSKWE